MLTCTHILCRYFSVFRGEIGHLNLSVVNIKKSISPRNTAKFHGENHFSAVKF